MTNFIQFSEEDERKKEQERKQKQLDSLEMQWQVFLVLPVIKIYHILVIWYGLFLCSSLCFAVSRGNIHATRVLDLFISLFFTAIVIK